MAEQLDKKTQVRFDTSTYRDFVQALQSRIKNYTQNQRYGAMGNRSLRTKAIIITVLHIGGYIALLTRGQPWRANMILYIHLGVTTSLIGFNILHDAGHGVFVPHRRVNDLIAQASSVLSGVSMDFRKVQHNQLHHTYTNIE